MNIFKLIIAKFLCTHSWYLYSETSVKDEHHRVVEIYHTLICKKCGKIKTIKQ